MVTSHRFTGMAGLTPITNTIMVASRPLYLGLLVLLLGSTFARPYPTHSPNNPSLYRRMEHDDSRTRAIRATEDALSSHRAWHKMHQDTIHNSTDGRIINNAEGWSEEHKKQISQLEQQLDHLKGGLTPKQYQQAEITAHMSNGNVEAFIDLADQKRAEKMKKKWEQSLSAIHEGTTHESDSE